MTKLIRTLTLLVLALPASLAAQEGDNEVIDEPPDRWRILLDVTYSGASGNQNLQFFDGGFRVTHLDTDVAEIEVATRARTGTDDGERIAERYQMSIKADAYPEARWSPFVFGSAERDRFKQLDLRSNAGGGVKYTIVRDEETEVSLSMAVLHSHEDFRTSGDSVDDGRLSWRFKGLRELREGVVVQNVSFYQPVWDAGNDYQASSDTQLNVQVFGGLAMTAGYQYERDSTPAEGVKPDDHYVKVGVQVQL